ncbi:MAG: hypothetical protein N3F08_04300 [Crenarchaeota archaeon]|nr:hypothetical protein [Thermoproteota archaeon]
MYYEKIHLENEGGKITDVEYVYEFTEEEKENWVLIYRFYEEERKCDRIVQLS